MVYVNMQTYSIEIESNEALITTNREFSDINMAIDSILDELDSQFYNVAVQLLPENKAEMTLLGTTNFERIYNIIIEKKEEKSDALLL